MIEVRCSCGRSFKAPDGYAGRRVKCPACGTRLSVPGGSPEGEDISFEDDYGIEPPSRRTCGACGTPVEENAVVCTNCGVDFTTGLGAQTTDPLAPRAEEGARGVPKAVICSVLNERAKSRASNM